MQQNLKSSLIYFILICKIHTPYDSGVYQILDISKIYKDKAFTKRLQKIVSEQVIWKHIILQ